MTYDIYYFNLAAIIMSSFVIHETSHYLTFRKYGRNPKFSIHNARFIVGNQEDYHALNPQQRIQVFLNGIIGGLIYLLIATYIYNPYALAILPYSLSCYVDIGGILQETKRLKNEKDAKLSNTN